MEQFLGAGILEVHGIHPTGSNHVPSDQRADQETSFTVPNMSGRPLGGGQTQTEDFRGLQWRTEQERRSLKDSYFSQPEIQSLFMRSVNLLFLETGAEEKKRTNRRIQDPSIEYLRTQQRHLGETRVHHAPTALEAGQRDQQQRETIAAHGIRVEEKSERLLAVIVVILDRKAELPREQEHHESNEAKHPTFSETGQPG